MVVREANNATLICKAAGYPEPYVMWRREDGDDINYNGDTGKNVIQYNNNSNNLQCGNILIYIIILYVYFNILGDYFI